MIEVIAAVVGNGSEESGGPPASIATDPDVVYLPLLHGVFMGRQPNTAEKPPNPKFFYPIFSPRLPLTWADYLSCLDELNKLLNKGLQEQLQLQKPGLCFGLLFWALVSCVILVIATASQVACGSSNTASGSPVGMVAIIAFPSIFVLACCLGCNRLCAFAVRDHGQISKEDIFLNPEAPLTLKLRDKLAELGVRYNVAFDLLSSKHIVDKTSEGGGREIVQPADAWQKKLAFHSGNGVVNLGGGVATPKLGLVHCVALRGKQVSSACAPPPPPLWQSDAESKVIIADGGAIWKGKWSVSSSTDPVIVGAVEALNKEMSRQRWRQIPFIIVIAVLALGGFCTFMSGVILKGLGIGCSFFEGSSNGSEEPANAVVMWIAYFCLVIGWLATMFMSGRQLHLFDDLGDLIRVVSALNKKNAGYDREINVCMESSMRIKQVSTGGTIEGGGGHSYPMMIIEDEPVLFFRNRTLAV